MLAWATTVNAGAQTTAPTAEELEALKATYVDVTMPACPNTVERGCCRQDVKPIVCKKPTPQERWMAVEVCRCFSVFLLPCFSVSTCLYLSLCLSHHVSMRFFMPSSARATS